MSIEKVTVVDIVSNIAHEAALLIGVPVIAILNRLIRIKGLETFGLDGQNIKYYFVQKRTGRQLLDEQTFRRVKTGGVLELRSKLLPYSHEKRPLR